MDPEDPTVAAVPVPTGSSAVDEAAWLQLPAELVPDSPDFTDIAIETEEPVESLFAEHLYRLLTEPLYSCWAGPGEGRPFIAAANVGLFFKYREPPLVPDVMLSVDIGDFTPDPDRKERNTYVVWEVGKPPDVVIELVSDRRGGEAGLKMRQYARIGVSYYAVFDRHNLLGQGLLRCFERTGSDYQPRPDTFFPDVGLGLTLWHGTYQAYTRQWIRWCDSQGRLIPTGQEKAEQECERADQERRRADAERQRADAERQRADAERQRREELEAQLRALGIDPSA